MNLSRPIRVLLLLPMVVAMNCIPAWSTGGDAWVREVGGYFIRFGFASLTAGDSYGASGTHRPLFGDTANFFDQSVGATDLSFYAEYGFNSWLTGVASTQYRTIVRQAQYVPTGLDSSVSGSGLGDIWIGVRLRLLPEGKTFSSTLTLSGKIPTGSTGQSIRLGSGTPDYEAVLALGSGFNIKGTILKGYSQFSGGYRLRTGAHDEFLYNAEAGVNLGEDIALQGTFDGLISTATFEDDPDRIGVANEQSYHRLSGSVILYPRNDMELSAGYRTTLFGRNTLNGNTIFVTLSIKD